MKTTRRVATTFTLSALLAACGSLPHRSEPPLIAGSPRADAANAVLFRAIALVQARVDRDWWRRLDR